MFFDKRHQYSSLQLGYPGFYFILLKTNIYIFSFSDQIADLYFTKKICKVALRIAKFAYSDLAVNWPQKLMSRLFLVNRQICVKLS